MKTIVDIGSRFIKVIITENDQIIAHNIHTSEGIQDGLIYNIERLSESIFECIRNAAYNLISNGEYSQDEILNNIYVTTSVGHCYIENKLECVNFFKKNKLTIDSKIEKSEEIQPWIEKYMIGDIYIDHMSNHLHLINKPIQHHKISINMSSAAQDIIRSIFNQFNSNLKYISFNNCRYVTNPKEIRIDVGYCGTRIFSHNNIQILPIGLYSLIKEISIIHKIPLREVEDILQISEKNNNFKNSAEITQMCQMFIINLFSQIINQQEKIDKNTYFVLQGGIHFIPFVYDFIESKFLIRTHSYKMFLSCVKNMNITPYINCIEMFTKLDSLEVL